jgi:hypothetical protein
VAWALSHGTPPNDRGRRSQDTTAPMFIDIASLAFGKNAKNLNESLLPKNCSLHGRIKSLFGCLGNCSAIH